MMNPQVQTSIHAQGGGYGPPPGGYGQPPGAVPPGAPMGAPPGVPPGGVPMAPPGGAPMAYPGGGMPPGGPGGPVNPELEKSLKTWFILSCLSLVCGCGILGLLPIWLTYTGKQSLMQGDVATAEKNVKIAKICVILGWVMLIVSVVLVAVWFLFLGGLAMLGM
jgi:hypothetical protein